MTNLPSEAFLKAVKAARTPRELSAGGLTRAYIDVSSIPGATELPRSLVVLLENVIRNAATDELAAAHALEIVTSGTSGTTGGEIDMMPARVLFQDFTGVPVFVDFAAMRDATAELGGDATKINPQIPCTLVIDHSVAADIDGFAEALTGNLKLEAERNVERFAFLKWAGASFENVQIVPPGQGICHQLNVEQIATVVGTDARAEGELPLACFDTLVGTDSHTPTANGLGVLGWGVGGIEAEAAALGQPIAMLVPEVVELKLTGQLAPDAQAMDLALTVAELLRHEGVVGKFVEVTGPGAETLTVPERACVSNMSPEYGSTVVLFPVDEATTDYLRLTGRDESQIALVEAYAKAQGVWGSDHCRHYATTIELDLSTVTRSLAGPSRPHNRVEPSQLKDRFWQRAQEQSHGEKNTRFTVEVEGHAYELGHGTLALAAITSCTTACDPAMVIAAGLTAKKAVERGLEPKPWVKKVLAPGSRATEEILKRANLLEPLAELGFYTCGFGCMSCIGNSGPIKAGLKVWADKMELTSILSGNRNFDGRISPDVAQNYLASPAVVVAYSLAGTLDVDLSQEPIATGKDDLPVYLADLMPSRAEIDAVLAEVLDRSLYLDEAAHLFEGPASWNILDVQPSERYPWSKTSTYIRRPPYFEIARKADVVAINDAYCLARFGDFVTTDHISPAGAIATNSPAGLYLQERGVEPDQFNTYGARRGNHEVMERGTFANVRLENHLAEGKRGCVTRDLLDGRMKSVWDAAVDYQDHGADLVILAGKLYGSGSSRDWAAKGPLLQGVRAVIAESFERIHRSNLVGMGILPLELCDTTLDELGLTGHERITVDPIDVSEGLPKSATTTVRAKRIDGSLVETTAKVRIDTPTEGAYIAAGGILPYVLTNLMA